MKVLEICPGVAFRPWTLFQQQFFSLRSDLMSILKHVRTRLTEPFRLFTMAGLSEDKLVAKKTKCHFTGFRRSYLSTFLHVFQFGEKFLPCKGRWKLSRISIITKRRVFFWLSGWLRIFCIVYANFDFHFVFFGMI